MPDKNGNYTVADIVQNALAENPAEAQKAMADVMLGKIADHLETKRQETADRFFNAIPQEDADETDPPEDEEELEDDEEGEEEFEDEDDFEYEDDEEELEDDEEGEEDDSNDGE